MGQRIAWVLVALVIGVLGWQVYAQGRSIEELRAKVESLRTELRGPGAIYDDEDPDYPLPEESAATVSRAPAAAEPPAAGEPEQRRTLPRPRRPVSSDEIARVESAVLSLLEADRPELREKLRAVVQEQQQSREDERREQWRERWISRREARLLELGETAGVTADQRQTLLTVMLAARDQIEEIMRNAKTAEEMTAAREKARELRDQGEEQIQGVLSPEQYEAYREMQQDERGRGGPRPGRGRR